MPTFLQDSSQSRSLTAWLYWCLDPNQDKRWNSWLCAMLECAEEREILRAVQFSKHWALKSFYTSLTQFKDLALIFHALCAGRPRAQLQVKRCDVQTSPSWALFFLHMFVCASYIRPENNKAKMAPSILFPNQIVTFRDLPSARRH